MVVLILIIGIVNLALGYALALHLGYGELPAILAGWNSAVQAPAPPPAVRAEEEPRPTPTAVEDAPLPPSDPLPEPAPAEAWTLDEKYVEASVLRLNLAMMRSAAKVTEIDARLRACGGRYDAETIRGCAKELLADCEIYLAEQREAAERFHERIGELGELASLAEQIELANLEQSAQVETTISNLQHMDFQSDLETAGERLLGEIDGLRAARHRLRDGQEVAFLTIARHQGRLTAIDEHLKIDPLTGLLNRIGLETTIARWSKEGRLKSHTLAAALVDLDDFGKLNKTCGTQTADRVLQHLGRYLGGVAGDALVSRYAGQRFLVLAQDSGPRALLRNVELMRQSIARMRFTHEARSIQLTVSAAIAEVPAGQPPEETCAHLEHVLTESRQTGTNRVLLWENDRAQAVDTPDLGAEACEVAL